MTPGGPAPVSGECCALPRSDGRLVGQGALRPRLWCAPHLSPLTARPSSSLDNAAGRRQGHRDIPVVHGWWQGVAPLHNTGLWPLRARLRAFCAAGPLAGELARLGGCAAGDAGVARLGEGVRVRGGSRGMAFSHVGEWESREGHMLILHFVYVEGLIQRD